MVRDLRCQRDPSCSTASVLKSDTHCAPPRQIAGKTRQIIRKMTGSGLPCLFISHNLLCAVQNIWVTEGQWPKNPIIKRSNRAATAIRSGLRHCGCDHCRERTRQPPLMHLDDIEPSLQLHRGLGAKLLASVRLLCRATPRWFQPDVC
jgi:hypothetical protein